MPDCDRTRVALMSVDQTVEFLVNASRVDPYLRYCVATIEVELTTLRSALRAVWDECEEYVIFEPVREQVKEALRIREFEAER